MLLFIFALLLHNHTLALALALVLTLIFTFTFINVFHARLDDEEGISVHLSHTFLALENQMKKIHDIFEVSLLYFDCDNTNNYDVDSMRNARQPEDKSKTRPQNILAYKHIVYSLLCKCVLDSFQSFIQQLKFDHIHQGVVSQRSLNPQLYQVQEEFECLKYVFYTHVPVVYCHDWALTYGERPEAKAEGRLEGSRNDENCREWEILLERSDLFVTSFSTWWTTEEGE